MRSNGFVEAFNLLQAEIHATARDRGWWEGARNDGELICLMQSEVSEALEAVFDEGRPDDKIPTFLGVEAELADVVIRVMDFAAARGFRVAEGVAALLPLGDCAGPDSDFVHTFASAQEVAGRVSAANTGWRSDALHISRLHYKLSQVLEALRIGNPADERVSGFTRAEVALAKVVTCSMSYAAGRNWRLAEAIVAKAEMNKGRAYKHGGKLF